MYLRIIFSIILLFSVIHTESSEIIKTSLLNSKKSKFEVKRDIFSSGIVIKIKKQIKKEIKPVENTKSLEQEIREKFFYEGFISQDSSLIAFINIDNEFCEVKKGDMIKNKILIKEIKKNEIIIEVESKIIKIPLKKENENI